MVLTMAAILCEYDTGCCVNSVVLFYNEGLEHEQGMSDCYV